MKNLKKIFQRRVLKFKLGVALRALVSYLVENFELGITKNVLNSKNHSTVTVSEAI